MMITKIKSADSKAKDCLEKVFFCNFIGRTDWSKFTGEVQLSVPEVIFQ
jgi:hypothetical protein